jgi:hypothetical protein
VTITRHGDAYEVQFDGRVSGQKYILSGVMVSGLWGRNGRSPEQALGGSAVPSARRTSGSRAGTPAATGTSAVSPAEPEVPPGWQLLWHDTFDSNVSGWSTGQREGEFARYQSELAEGRYNLVAERLDPKRSAYVWRSIKVNAGSQFHISMEVAEEEASTGGGCGLRFAASGGAFSTLFIVSDADGKFMVRRQDEDGNPHTLIAWTASSAIRSGQINRLSVISDRSQLIFFVNGQPVAKADVEQPDMQWVGVSAWVGSSDPVRCSCDNVRINVE